MLGLAAVRVMPKGTFVARRGFPAVVAVRGLGGAAFAGVGAYLPLLLRCSMTSARRGPG